MNTLKEWLTPKLEDLGLSVKDFSLEIGVDESTIRKYFSDARRPSREVIVKICRYIGVPVEEGAAQFESNKVGRPIGSKTVPVGKQKKEVMNRIQRQRLFGGAGLGSSEIV